MSLFKHYKFNIGLCGVILIVVLRIAIGWHFFYEGIHKFDPHDEFSSKGFLGVAKGPVAPFFHEMLPDINGLKRLEIGPAMDAEGKPVMEKGKEVKTFTVYEKAWNDYYARFYRQHNLDASDKAALKKQVDDIYLRYLQSLRNGAADVEKDVLAYKESLKRYRETKKTIRNDAEFEQIRRWDAMLAYRAEANQWISMLDGMGNGLQSDMARTISPHLAGEQGQIITGPEKALIPNPIAPTHMQSLDYAVMFGLTAIGFCMIVGFCNRLACLGGAVFLINVILTTWPVPGVHPPLPSAVGNFLFISKDTIELIALILLASLPAGRWAGLDYFLWNCGGKQLCKRLGLEKCLGDN